MGMTANLGWMDLNCKFGIYLNTPNKIFLGSSRNGRGQGHVTTWRAVEKISNGHISATVHWIHFMFGSTVGVIISAARKGRAFKFYTDLGTEAHNKICTQDVP